MNPSGKRFDPIILRSQSTFRCLLAAASRPGSLPKLPDTAESPDIALLHAVLDHETSFGTVGVEQDAAYALGYETGARLVSPDKADFVLVRGGHSRGALTRMRHGTLEEPHLGATAIFFVRRLSSDGAITLELSGPGVDGHKALRVDGFAIAEVEALNRSRAEYPRGVDIYMVDEAGRVAGLPRSTRLEVRETA